MTSFEHQPLLTIVTINKNNAGGLRRTILSILPLLSAEVRYLVIDGASCDGSLEVAQSLLARHDHVRIISEMDAGIYDAMNKGWKLSSSEYVAFLNSGDEVVADAYGSLLAALADRHSDVVYGRVFIARECGARLGLHERHPRHLRSDTLPHPATAVRRALLMQLGGFNERFRITADRDFFIRAYKQQASFLYVPVTLAVFYLGGVSSGWKAELESTNLSKAHGYIGFLGWMVRVAWTRLFTSLPITDEQLFCVLQYGRNLQSSALRLMRQRDER